MYVLFIDRAIYQPISINSQKHMHIQIWDHLGTSIVRHGTSKYRHTKTVSRFDVAFPKLHVLRGFDARNHLSIYMLNNGDQIMNPNDDA